MAKQATINSSKKSSDSYDAASLERERLTSLINSMTAGVIALDDKLKVIIYNGSALNILNTNILRAGVAITEVLNLVDNNNKKLDLKKIVRNIRVAWVSRDYVLNYPDGSAINIHISVAPVHTGYGKSANQGFVVVLRDITHEKSLEEERDEFISVVSHELRTPVAIAEGNLGNALFIAEKNQDIEAIKNTIKQAHDQIAFLSGMINDLSMLSRAERGQLALETTDINLHDLIHRLQSEYEPVAAKKGLQLFTSVSRKLELLHTSELYLREILQNFVTNSIKYTLKGSVTIEAKPFSGGAAIFVRDTGIGISKADQKKVFEKFFRSEDYRTRTTGGTGLGLYVTAKLSRIIKARVEIESQLNEGSCFSIYVPNIQRSAR